MTTLDPALFAEQLELEYVGDDAPGIARRRRGRGWSFHGPDGQLIGGEERDRCLRLAIPPAWRDVWICPSPGGHLQARGTDDAERRQYRYHDRWTEGRRMANFDRLRSMGDHLAEVRRSLDVLLDESTDERQRATAAMVRLVDAGLARIGGERSASEFGHYGASTLLREHVEVSDTGVVLNYPGKHGVERHVEVADPVLAEVLLQMEAVCDCLFHVHVEGEPRAITAEDANAMLSAMTDGWMTCKDFRTWGGSAVALGARMEGADPVQAVDAAAEALGNTRAVARAAYVHPDVLEEDTGAMEAAWAASRSSVRFDRRERALAKLLEESEPLLDRWLRTA